MVQKYVLALKNLGQKKLVWRMFGRKSIWAKRRLVKWYGQMSPGQMLPGQMSMWQLESVLDVPRKIALKFHQNQVRNSWEIADTEFLSNSITVMLGWCWVVVELGFWQYDF